MEEGWNYYEGKKVFIKLKNNRQYSGTIIKVDANSLPLVWITLNDKYNQRIMFSTGEIEVVQEERE